MPRDDEKLLRQLSLVSYLLSSGRPRSTRDIQSSVEGYATMKDETFARRFYADRDDLATAGVVIEQVDDADDPTGYAYSLPAQNYYLADLHLTDEERRSLALVLAVMEGHFAYARPLRLALASLLGGQTGPSGDDVDRLAIRLAADREASAAGDRLARLDEAVARGKSVVFDYRTVRGDHAARTVDPYSLFRIAGHWYVVGLDHDRVDLRMFRLGRIQGAVHFLTKKPRDFSIPDDYDPEAFRSRPPWLLGTAVGVARVRLDPALSWWVERTYPGIPARAHAEVAGCEAENVAIDLPYADAHALISWVLGLGEQAELLGPPELRARLLAGLDAILAAHEAPDA